MRVIRVNNECSSNIERRVHKVEYDKKVFSAKTAANVKQGKREEIFVKFLTIVLSLPIKLDTGKVYYKDYQCG